MTTGSITYLCLGDSYTIGTGVSLEQSWPYQLAERLLEAGLPADEPVILAKNGWTTRDLWKALAERELEPAYDFSTLLIGVNDQYDGLTLEDYREGFSRLLSRAIQLTGDAPGLVFVLSIPDWSVTPFAEDHDPEKIRAEIQRFNQINQQITAQRGCSYVNITPISRLAKQGPSWLAEDGLHPSGKMYSRWARLLFPDVFDRFSPNR
jgi:lysophospholipase L1-like esterase